MSASVPDAVLTVQELQRTFCSNYSEASLASMKSQVALAHCRMFSVLGSTGQPVIHSKPGNASASQQSQAQGFLGLPTFLLPLVPQSRMVTSRQLSKAVPHGTSFVLGFGVLLLERMKQTQLWTLRAPWHLTFSLIHPYSATRKSEAGSLLDSVTLTPPT